MSTFEAAYKSLLQGVSQQLPQERLDGQVTAQVNMMSDPVTNVRRRPGVVPRVLFDFSADPSELVSVFTDIGGQRVHLILNIGTGIMAILTDQYALTAYADFGAYGRASSTSSIRMVSVGNELFLANTEKMPSLVAGSSGPIPNERRGFYYILAGAFGRTYTMTVTGTGGVIASASYTTPSGALSGDSLLTTPEYIAEELRIRLLAVQPALFTVRDGPYVYVQYSDTINITTTSSTTYTITSNGGWVRAIGDLPARLPPDANGYVVRVGTGEASSYYRFNYSTQEWLETGAIGSPSGISNAPASLSWTGVYWLVNVNPFEGRLAGDDVTNPTHEWMTYGITGMSAYQGRLVIMSGPLVSLSASGKPRRFFRSTVSNVIPSDPIEIGSTSITSAAYEWAIPFQKDLLLFSRAYQAVIPSGNQAITPSTATVVPTSGHEVDTTCGPINIGRTLMYCNPRSESFFGVLEMVPSQYTDSQYISQDSTPHLPKFMPGRCRFAVASSVANIALFAPTGDRHTLIVHEYHWDGDNKVQQAWHQWTFPYEVATAHFASETIAVVLQNGPWFFCCSIDPRAGSVTQDGWQKSFVDMQVSVAYSDNTIYIPSNFRTFDPTIATKMVATIASGPAAGELIGTTPNGDNTALISVLSHESGQAMLGVPYMSTLVPTPPQVRDYKENVIHSGKATLLRFMVGTRDSADYSVEVQDERQEMDEHGVPVLHWDSPELDLGVSLNTDHATNIVPCRTDLRSTELKLYTDGPGELNVVSLEYVGRYQPKIKRR